MTGFNVCPRKSGFYGQQVVTHQNNNNRDHKFGGHKTGDHLFPWL